MARTLADLETEIRWKYDIDSFTARHSQSAIFQRINAAYRALRARLTAAGCKTYLVTHEVAYTATGRNGAHNGTTFVPLPDPIATAGYELIDSVAVLDGTRWIPLRKGSMQGEIYEADGATTGLPEAWAALAGNVEVKGTGTVPGLEIVVWPASDRPRTYRVTGLPTWTDLTATTAEIYDLIGALDYCIACVGVELSSRDEDVNPAIVQARLLERETLYGECLKRARRIDPPVSRRVNVRRFR